MELSSLVAAAEPSSNHTFAPNPGASDQRLHDQARGSPERLPGVASMNLSPVSNGAANGHPPASPQAEPRNVRFELVSSEGQYRARLPMRVSIFPHDATESIITTVKNFYGLYSSPTSSKGVSFEDEQGNTLIARYENFRNNMVVYVRVIEEPTGSPGSFGGHSYHHHSGPLAVQPYMGPDGVGPQPPAQHLYEAHMSRPASRTSRRRSPSPNGAGRGRRSTSVGTNQSAAKKGRSRSVRPRGDGCNDSANGYSSGDGAPGSASGKNKDQIGNTEISVDNIVEGGRRKRAKFESSELPLFAPPQMPATTSNPSVSPARRIEHNRASLPFAYPGPNPFTNPRPLQSPQSNGNTFSYAGAYTTPSSDNRRTRGSIGYPTGLGIGGIGMGQPILPTPDPTVGSCMSEEDKDVAIQLMRLGDISNISHGRTSASTLDDTFSGRADAASSTGATSDVDSESEEELPAARRQKLDMAGASRKIYPTTEGHHDSTEVSGDDGDFEDGLEEGLMGAPKTKPIKNILQNPNGAKPKVHTQGVSVKPKALKIPKAPKPAGGTKVKKMTANGVHGPMSPASMPVSRKQSIASNGGVLTPGAVGEDDQPDLSTKPRCQRCRKSKKGCDRQRPCGRCRDAGIPAEMCISEDEGNGRKGRYGRHMGVPILKKEDTAPVQPPTLLPAAPIAPAMPHPFAAGFPLDKMKKRKR